MDRFKKKTDENGERTSLKIKISMRKTAKMIAVVSCTILMLAACSPKKEVEFIVIVSSAGATSAADTGVTRRAVHNTIPLKK